MLVGRVCVGIWMVAAVACSGGAPGSGASSSGSLELGPDDAACRAHAGVDACLSDRAHECFYGPDLWAPTATGEPCPPAEPVCESHLAQGPGLLFDEGDMAACRAHETLETCFADVAHRCLWPPAILMPCTADGACPPRPTCQTTFPDCGTLGPFIDVAVAR